MLEDGLVAFLNDDSSIASEIEGRIYPLVIPNAAQVPALAYQRVSTRRPTAHDGAVDHAFAVVQITVQAVSFAHMLTLAALIRRKLHGFSGYLPDGTQVFKSEITGESHGDVQNGDAVLSRLDAQIHHREN
ncbi:MAG: DUF3168 domain-containing protein [Anaerolineae bacterium]|mgnify:CR=1 FL=1|nr:DUF3168 domain-containing protein [Thermoflexales bacterium]